MEIKSFKDVVYPKLSVLMSILSSIVLNKQSRDIIIHLFDDIGLKVDSPELWLDSNPTNSETESNLEEVTVTS